MLSWKVGDGLSIKLGIEQIIGMDSHYILSDDLRDYLNDYGLTALHHIRNVSETWVKALSGSLIGFLQKI